MGGVIPEPVRQRQEDQYKFEVSLVYTANISQEKPKLKTKRPKLSL